MNCRKFQEMLPDLLLDPRSVPGATAEEARGHRQVCSQCARDWREYASTMQLLEEWQVPEPSPYFDTRLAARIREARDEAPGWWERMRLRWAIGGNLNLRPAMAATFALLLIVGGGSYAGFWSMNRTMAPSQQHVSATVNDLELLDSNAQALQQLAAFDDTAPDSGAATAVRSN
jgi:predicted anti-sigma-YlaC factor YlaD